MPLNPGQRHVLNLGCGAQQLDHGGSAAGMGLHAQVERAQPAVYEEAVERARHGAGGVLDEAHALVPVGVAGDDRPAHHVGVAAEVLGGGVHDEIGPELQRPLVGRCGERVVDHDHGVSARRDDGPDVDHVELGVGRRLDPDQAGLRADRLRHRVDVGLIDQVVGQPPPRHDLVHQAVGAAVQIARQDDVRAGRARRRDQRVLGGQAGGTVTASPPSSSPSAVSSALRVGLAVRA